MFGIHCETHCHRCIDIFDVFSILARLTEACNTAAWIGLRNYHNSQVACSCVAFIEMLGQDSLVLRTLLQAGQEVLFHLNGNLTTAGDQRWEQAKKNDELIGTVDFYQVS